MADIYRIGVSIAMTNGVSAVLGVIGRDLLGLHRHIDETSAKLGRVKLAMAGLGGVVVGGAVLGGMADLVRHGGELVDQQARLKMLGVSNVEVAQATAQAWKNSADVLGSSVTRNLELIREAKGAFGTVAEANALSPFLSQADQVRTLANGGRPDDRGMQMLMKAIEVRGDVRYKPNGELDADYTKSGINSALKFLNASGGQIDAGTLKGLITMAGPMAKMMAPDAFYRTMLTVTEELQQKAGTALSAAGRALYGGIMPQRNSNELARLGLINPKMVHVRRGGNVSIDQGALTGFDVLNGPGGLAEWADKIARPAFHADYLKASRRNPKLTEQQYDQQELYRALPTETFRRLLGIFLQQAESVNKGAANYDQAQGLDAQKTAINESYSAKVNAFRTAWENLLTALGGPLVGPATDIVKRLAEGLTSMGQWAAANPGLVLRIEQVTAGLAALAVVGGSLTIVGAALGPFTGALSAFLGTMGGAQVGAATTAAAALGGGSLLGVAGGLIALSAAVVGLPPLLHAAVDGLNEMLGIKGTPDASGRGGQNREREYLRTHDGPSIPGVTPKPTESWGDWFRRETAGAAPHQQLRGGGATVQPQSYVPPASPGVSVTPASYVPPPANSRPIVVNSYTTLDGRVLTRTVTTQQERNAARDPSGINGFDGRQTMLPPSVISA